MRRNLTTILMPDQVIECIYPVPHSKTGKYNLSSIVFGEWSNCYKCTKIVAFAEEKVVFYA